VEQDSYLYRLNGIRFSFELLCCKSILRKKQNNLHQILDSTLF
jgi:hypothetical protein